MKNLTLQCVSDFVIWKMWQKCSNFTVDEICWNWKYPHIAEFVNDTCKLHKIYGPIITKSKSTVLIVLKGSKCDVTEFEDQFINNLCLEIPNAICKFTIIRTMCKIVLKLRCARPGLDWGVKSEFNKLYILFYQFNSTPNVVEKAFS